MGYETIKQVRGDNEAVEQTLMRDKPLLPARASFRISPLHVFVRMPVKGQYTFPKYERIFCRTSKITT
jgi:hypothetical protein